MKILSLIGVTTVAYIILLMALDIPTVQVDPAGNCVQVLSPTGEYYCSNLPDRYTIEYVGWRE